MAQISMEAALEAARKRVGDLAWENTLLAAQVAETEAENERLRAQAPPEAQPAAARSAEAEGYGAPADQAMR
jgi:hypothetical protein